jgi:hypothetical protein
MDGCDRCRCNQAGGARCPRRRSREMSGRAAIGRLICIVPAAAGNLEGRRWRNQTN